MDGADNKEKSLKLAQILVLTGHKPSLPSEKIKRHAVSFVGYRRNSTDDQTETSQPRQAQLIEDYAKKNGLVRVREDFVDEGCSGSTVVGRFGFMEMIKFAKTGAVDIVVIEHPDRFSRYIIDALKYFAILEHHRVELHDTKFGRLNRMHFYIFGILASEGVKRIIELMSTGRRNAVHAGKHMGQPPFAYRRHPSERGARIIIEERAQIVVQMYRDCADGVGARTIALQLNARGVPSPRECALTDNMRPLPKKKILWTPREVMVLIRNPIYMGYLIYGRSSVQADPETPEIVKRETHHEDDIEFEPAPHFQIVDEKLWWAANLALAERSFGRGSEDTRGKVHLLTPVSSCEICGARMNVFSNYGWSVYRCTAAHFKARECNGLRAIRADWSERGVLEAVREHAFIPEDDAKFRRRLQAACDVQNAQKKSELKQVQSEIARIDAMVHNSMMQSLIAGLCGERVERQRRELESQIFMLQQREAELSLDLKPDEGLARLNNMRDVIDQLIELCPFKPTNADEQKLAIMFRRLVPSVQFGAPDEKGRRHLAVTIDRLGVIDAAISKICDAEKIVVNVLIDTVEGVQKEKQQRIADRNELVAQAAESGIHHLPDDIWDELSKHVSEKKPDDVFEPKTLINGMLCLLKSGAPTTSLPTYYGDRDEFLRAAKRLVYSGEWDAFARALRLQYPDILKGADLRRFETSCWRRSIRGANSPLKAISIDRSLVKSLISKSNDEKEIRRLKVALAVAEGKSKAETAKNLGYWPSHVTNIVEKLRYSGLNALLTKQKSQITDSKSRLTAEQRQELFQLARGGRHPTEPRGLNLRDLIEHCEERYGVTYKRGGIATILRTQKIKLKEANKDAFRGLEPAQKQKLAPLKAMLDRRPNA